MKTILVKRTIDAPIERVFEVLSDHAGYGAFPGVKDARLLKEGRQEPNGVGALRRIDLGAIWFEEEITVFERPTRMDYRITRSRPPIEHAGGSIRLEETATGPLATWTSTFRLDVPLLGNILSPLAASAGEKAFGAMLKAVEQRLDKA